MDGKWGREGWRKRGVNEDTQVLGLSPLKDRGGLFRREEDCSRGEITQGVEEVPFLTWRLSHPSGPAVIAGYSGLSSRETSWQEVYVWKFLAWRWYLETWFLHL